MPQLEEHKVIIVGGSFDRTNAELLSAIKEMAVKTVIHVNTYQELEKLVNDKPMGCKITCYDPSILFWLHIIFMEDKRCFNI